MTSKAIDLDNCLSVQRFTATTASGGDGRLRSDRSVKVDERRQLNDIDRSQNYRVVDSP